MARMLAVGFLLMLALVLPPGVIAEKPETAAQKKPDYSPLAWPKPPSGGELLGRLALITFLALVVLGLTLWWARRVARLPAPKPGEATPLKLVESVALGSGCSLHLLEVDQSCFVVGVDRSGLRSIQLVSEPFEQALEQASVREAAGLEEEGASKQFPRVP